MDNWGGENQRRLPGEGGLGWGKVWRDMSGLKQMVTGLESSLSVSVCFSWFIFFSVSVLCLHFFLSLFYFSLCLFVFLFFSPLCFTFCVQCQGN